MKPIIALLMSMMCVFQYSVSQAAQLTGTGWGDTEAQARREALADLSAQISVNVRSKTRISQSVSAQGGGKERSEAIKQVNENLIETASELPVLGAEFNTRRADGHMKVEASLSSGKSLPLYTQKLAELRSQLAEGGAKLDKLVGAEARYHAIMELLTALDEYRKLATVALYLGANPALPGVDETVLREKLRAASKQVDSLDLAARLLADGMDEPGIYVFPARARNSNEITPFAALLKDKLATQLKTVQSPKDARHMLLGEYAETADGMDVTYHLVDSEAQTLRTNSAHLAKAAYAGLETQPRTADFEQLLKAGVAVSGDLHVEISTNRGSRDLLFNEGDEVELFVKLSETGYFYVLGHTVKTDEKNSYLLELGEAEGARKFVKFVNADDANKWISVGKFNVAPPFGVEGLQVFGSNKDMIDSLPPAKLDNASGLYLVAAAPQEGVVKTRALVKKKAAAAQSAEGSLLFTTRHK